ncbi:MAG TPA: hypothetical protein VD969_04205 [Symbiobacteriaceae bacterium]|nr:hypothetical protein [Symbiobacteriaceae bacterium]
MSDQTNRTPARSTDRKTDAQAVPYLDHGVPSSVAMDNPDDSQLGADRTQSRDERA